MPEIKNTIIIKTIDEMRTFTAEAKMRKSGLGLVPTMGALHDGHLSLIRRSVSENDLTVVSIFVNPIQFNDTADLEAYPKTLSTDADLAAEAGAAVIFAPDADEMYPKGFSTYVDMAGITEKLCGASRDSHFKGVLTVVNKLFCIVDPERAYFGEKDIQQLTIVKKMVSDLCMNIEIVECPTIREDDGLAMSSRNKRLGPEERIASRSIFLALTAAKALYDKGEKSPEKLTFIMQDIIKKEPLLRIDYAELVDPENFETPEAAKSGNLLMLAVNAGEVRLIDNMRL